MASKTVSYTQDELTAIWEKRAERDECNWFNVNGLQAQWVAEEETYQAFALHTTPAPYNDHSDHGAFVTCTRWRANKDATWTRWGS